MSSSNAVAQQAQSARSTMNKQEHTSGVSATEIQQEHVEVDDVVCSSHASIRRGLNTSKAQGHQLGVWQ